MISDVRPPCLDLKNLKGLCGSDTRDRGDRSLGGGQGLLGEGEGERCGPVLE